MAREFRSKKPTVDASRLCGAADAILHALESGGGRRAVVRVMVIEPGVAGQVPGFTFAELTEAMSMLLRLGIVEPAGNHP